MNWGKTKLRIAGTCVMMLTATFGVGVANAATFFNIGSGNAAFDTSAVPDALVLTDLELNLLDGSGVTLTLDAVTGPLITSTAAGAYTWGAGAADSLTVSDSVGTVILEGQIDSAQAFLQGTHVVFSFALLTVTDLLGDTGTGFFQFTAPLDTDQDGVSAHESFTTTNDLVGNGQFDDVDPTYGAALPVPLPAGGAMGLLVLGGLGVIAAFRKRSRSM